MNKWNALCCIAVLFIPLGAGAYEDPGRPVPHWQILHDKSSINWAVKYSGQTIRGTFPDFTAEITFDEARVSMSRATITISTAKVRSDDKDAQENLPTAEWLNPVDYPNAVFKTNQADSIKHIQDDQYTMEGEFILHGYKTHFAIPFTLRFTTDKETWTPTRYAVADGQFTIHRLDFKIGQGDWARTDSLANDVTVHFHLEARQLQPLVK